MANNNTTQLDLLKSLTTSGGATDTLNITGTVTSTPSGTQAISGTVGVNNFPATQPVSGTVSVNALPTGSNVIGHVITDAGSVTNATLSAETTKVIGTVNISASQSVTANAGTNLNTSLLALDSTVAKDASLTTLNTSVNGLLKPASTLAAVTSLGSITNPLPAGTNVIGHVIVDTAPTTPVTGTFFQSTQPVSAVSLPLPTNAVQEQMGNLDTHTQLLQVLISEVRKTNFLLSQLNNVDPTSVDANDLLPNPIYN